MEKFAVKDIRSIRLKDSYAFFILFILCVIFVCIKIPNLNIPFYWDEAWVYAPGIKAMAQTGISLLPGALPDLYSRGHPLLFFCTGAIWVKNFGGSFISLHLFALAIAISFVFTLFYIVKKLFDSTMALIVASITLAQPVFFAQSAIVLPEMLLSLWAILTFYHFVVNNRYYYVVFGTLMLLTKESGIAIIGGLMIYQCISFLTQKITLLSFKAFIQNLVFISIPLLPYMAFLLIQHHQRGYYLFQNHLDLIYFNWKTLQEKLRHCYYNLFMQQGRAFITWSFLILFGLLYKRIPVIIRLIIIAGFIIGVKIFFRNWALSGWLTLALMAIGTSMYYYWVHIKYATGSKETERLLAMLFTLVVVSIVFSSINFLLSRYLLVLMPLMILYICYYVRAFLQFQTLPVHAWALLMVSVMIYNAIAGCNYTGDDSPKYIQAVKLQQMMVKYMEEQNMQKDTICCQKTIMQIVFKNPASGYLSGNTTFSNMTNKLDKSTEYVIYTNIDFDPPFYFDETDTLPPFQVVKKFDYGVAHGKLFKRTL